MCNVYVDHVFLCSNMYIGIYVHGFRQSSSTPYGLIWAQPAKRPGIIGLIGTRRDMCPTYPSCSKVLFGPSLNALDFSKSVAPCGNLRHSVQLVVRSSKMA